MASPSTPPTMSFSTMFLVLFWLFPSSHSLHYDAIFSFGDSLSDTGNVQVAGLPYGMTFFGRTSLLTQWGCHCFRRRRRRVTASGKVPISPTRPPRPSISTSSTAEDSEANSGSMPP
ncbi:hypothetical protein OPV22_013388 [Ensete ventricosum]|uniref:GDSL esterase/lipase n=1 Tax=Ensete ventricosum TaxID=4639 RepID=A0AAV8R953_ENSVE|nr:hypothetical protein OPV22_013388 [Ensete ventricosum]